MSSSLENRQFHFSIQPHKPVWELIGPTRSHPALSNVGMQVSGWVGKRRFTQPIDLSNATAHYEQSIPSKQGRIQQLELMPHSMKSGLRLRVIFALPENHPLFLWKVELENTGDTSIAIEHIDLLQAWRYGDLPQPVIRNLGQDDAVFFSNGWQSWSYCGAYTSRDRFHRTRLGFLRSPVGENAGTPQPRRRGRFSSDMFGVLADRRRRRGILAGFVSQQMHFGSLQADLLSDSPILEMWANGDAALLPPGKKSCTDWACIQWVDLDASTPLEPYLQAVARQNGMAAQQTPVPTGWCSWYQFVTAQYTSNLCAADIQRNIKALDQAQPDLPLKVIQIDDGFQRQIGDWYSAAPTFPDGVQSLASEIRSAGFTPGLWLAPFIVHPRSKLARDHPEWLLRGRLNRPVNAGFLWNTFATALDITHPDALAYTQEVIASAVHRWGFPYLKLDFLYAAALPGQHLDRTLTRAQVLRKGLEALRQAAGKDTYLLGCGCPLGPAIGIVDAMRIGPDTSQRWLPHFNGIEFFFKGEKDFPSVFNALHNAVTRAPLHQHWWVNDPDCLLLRKETHLTRVEVMTAATIIALTGGSLFLSDELANLSPAEIRMAKRLLPVIGKRAQVLDWLEREHPRHLRVDLENQTGVWHLLALINWDDQPRDASIRLDEFGLSPHQAASMQTWARAFWALSASNPDNYPKLWDNRQLDLGTIPAHGSILLAVRRFPPDTPHYLGGDLHISQGLEVMSWESSAKQVIFDLARPGRADGTIDLALPHAPRIALQDGKPLPWTNVETGCYRFKVAFNHQARVQVAW